jgi:glutaredoxin
VACEQVKEFLSRTGREFIERNVDTDLDAYDELIARGWRTVPVTFVRDAAIAGFDEAALRSAVDDDT